MGFGRKWSNSRQIQLNSGRADGCVPAVGVWLPDGLPARVPCQSLRLDEAVLELGSCHQTLLPGHPLRHGEHVPRVVHH